MAKPISRAEQSQTKFNSIKDSQRKRKGELQILISLFWLDLLHFYMPSHVPEYFCGCLLYTPLHLYSLLMLGHRHCNRTGREIPLVGKQDRGAKKGPCWLVGCVAAVIRVAEGSPQGPCSCKVEGQSCRRGLWGYRMTGALINVPCEIHADTQRRT